jgi:hypothetical protein
VPQSQCSDFARGAQRVCIATLRAELEEEGAVVDANGASNIQGICEAAGSVGAVVCKEGAVKLDRSSVKGFCNDLSASFAALSSLGCEAVVEESKSLNPPEETEKMLQTCNQLGASVRRRYVPLCIKRFTEKGLPPTGKPDPEPKPPPFKPGEETSI